MKDLIEARDAEYRGDVHQPRHPIPMHNTSHDDLECRHDKGPIGEGSRETERDCEEGKACVLMIHEG